MLTTLKAQPGKQVAHRFASFLTLDEQLKIASERTYQLLGEGKDKDKDKDRDRQKPASGRAGDSQRPRL